MGKKRSTKLIMVMLFLLAGCMVFSINAQAARKKSSNKIKWKLSKGTLTIYGKGKMSRKSFNWGTLKKKQKKKVKKVIIKKGITSISDTAFQDMKNLKSVKIPSTVKKIGYESFSRTAIKELKIPSSVKKIGNQAFMIKKLRKLTLPGNFTFDPEDADACHLVGGDIPGDNKLTVTFTTKLNLENASLFTAGKYVLSKKDPAYCSVDGCIYTKDRKTLVRVPMRKKKLKIIEGCTELCTHSLLHGIYSDAYFDANCNVSEIELPASLTSVNSTKYPAFSYERAVLNIKKVTIRTRQLNGKSLAALAYDLYIDPKLLMEQLPEQISYKDGKYISKDGVWLKKNPYKQQTPLY